MPVITQVRAKREASYEFDRSSDYKMFIDWALAYVLHYCGIEAEYRMTF
ncbi:MAG: hypothetical protein JW828_03930 [Sedimentisphaerales bacterium]|nr:hypothetical protein [Sedimentisphaerales bacterium]